MYTLYFFPGSASLAVHWMLIELGAEFEAKEVDFTSRAQKSPEFLAINPAGHVPALVIDGIPHAECAALLMLLAERHPQQGLAPAPGDPHRADYLQRMVYLANTMQPAFRAWFYPEEPAGAENQEVAMSQARTRIEAAWERVDGWLADGRPYVLGERLSAADFLGAMLVRWSRNMPRPAEAWPNIARYASSMRSMPSLQEVHRREGLTDWIGDRPSAH